MDMRKDYILRLIEEGRRVLAKIMRLRAEGNELGAMEASAAALKGILGLDIGVLSMLSTESVIRILSSTDDGMDPDKFLLAADLLTEHGGEGPKRLASALYAEVALQTGPEPVTARIDRVMMAAKEDINLLPPRTLMGLIQVFENSGMYATCEDAAYALATNSGFSDESYALLERLFARLPENDDATLEAGGLPRDEVVDGWKGLERLYGKSR